MNITQFTYSAIETKKCSMAERSMTASTLGKRGLDLLWRNGKHSRMREYLGLDLLCSSYPLGKCPGSYPRQAPDATKQEIWQNQRRDIGRNSEMGTPVL